MLEPLDHISYSHLHLLACPYAAFLRYEAALKGPTTPWLALGSALHYALEFTHKEGAFNPQKAVKLFQDEFNRIIVDDDVFIGYPLLKKLEAEGIEMLGVYSEQIKSGIISEYPLALEKEFSIPVAGTKIIGRIDKVEVDEDGEYTVTDFKSGKEKPKEWDLRHNLQFTTYYWACFLIYGKYPKKLIWHHLRTGELLETVRTPYDIKNLTDMIQNAVTMREQDIRHRIFNDQICGWCDYRGDTCDDQELEQKILNKEPLGLKKWET